MEELEIIEFLLHDERFEDTVLVTDTEIKTEVKTENFTRAFLDLLSKMEAPYKICHGTITIARPQDDLFEEKDDLTPVEEHFENL